MIIYVALAVAVFCLYALWKIVLPAVSNARSGRPDLSKKAQLNVLITGASKGLGFNMAKKFVQLKHNVVICARSKESVENAVVELNKLDGGKAYGTTCDISVEKELLDLAAFAKQNMGELNLWINNAGSTGYVLCNV
jgi:chlorophyll(ide) b reductase